LIITQVVAFTLRSLSLHETFSLVCLQWQAMEFPVFSVTTWVYTAAFVLIYPYPNCKTTHFTCARHPCKQT